MSELGSSKLIAVANLVDDPNKEEEEEEKKNGKSTCKEKSSFFRIKSISLYARLIIKECKN